MNTRLLILVLSSLLLLSTSGRAELVRVAVAANFSAPMKSIADEFQRLTGHRVQPVFGSSGKLYAQIMNGAPYQVFLSADTVKPEKLIEHNKADPATRFTYAKGTLVLWTADEKMERIEPGIILQYPLRYLALANARVAPYGKAAREVLEHLDLWRRVENKVVSGENISQTYQFVSTGNADMGFIALSQVIKDGRINRGRGWVVPQAYHAPIRQDAVLLKNGENNPAALALMDFLKSDRALAMIRDYGYQL